jgi:hypothetical protein
MTVLESVIGFAIAALAFAVIAAIWIGERKKELRIPTAVLVLVLGSCLIYWFGKRKSEANEQAREADLQAAVDREAAQKDREAARRERAAAESSRRDQLAAIEATKLICTQCAEEKMAHVRQAQNHGIATGTALLASIGAGECAKYFNAGWKLFLTDGTEIKNEAVEVWEAESDIRLDWSVVKVMSVTERGVRFLAPNLQTAGHRPAGETSGLGFTIDRSQGCPPRTAIYRVSNLSVAAAAIDGNDHQLLAILGAHKDDL